MPNYSKIVYELTPTEQGAVMRHFRCRQWEIPAKLEGLFLAALAVVVDKGACGLDADRLVQSGEIEIGRPRAEEMFDVCENAFVVPRASER